MARVREVGTKWGGFWGKGLELLNVEREFVPVRNSGLRVPPFSRAREKVDRRESAETDEGGRQRVERTLIRQLR